MTCHRDKINPFHLLTTFGLLPGNLALVAAQVLFLVLRQIHSFQCKRHLKRRKRRVIDYVRRDNRRTTQRHSDEMALTSKSDTNWFRMSPTVVDRRSWLLTQILCFVIDNLRSIDNKIICRPMNSPLTRTVNCRTNLASEMAHEANFVSLSPRLSFFIVITAEEERKKDLLGNLNNWIVSLRLSFWCSVNALFVRRPFWLQFNYCARSLLYRTFLLLLCFSLHETSLSLSAAKGGM